MKLSVAIKHVEHVGRGRFVTAIRRELPQAVVVLDRYRSVWDTARRAWEYAFADPEATHHLVLDDDVRLGPRFSEAIRPDCPTLLVDGETGGAICMPTPLVRTWLDWCDENVRENYPHDDGRLLLWAHLTGQRVARSTTRAVTHGEARSILQHRRSRKPDLDRAWRFARIGGAA